jgi:hypothetical protein
VKVTGDIVGVYEVSLSLISMYLECIMYRYMSEFQWQALKGVAPVSIQARNHVGGKQAGD